MTPHVVRVCTYDQWWEAPTVLIYVEAALKFRFSCNTTFAFIGSQALIPELQNEEVLRKMITIEFHQLIITVLSLLLGGFLLTGRRRQFFYVVWKTLPRDVL